MARFEIEAAVKNAGGVKGDIAGISNSLDKLNDRYSSLTREIAKSTAVSRGLEGDLKALNAQFKSGAISQGQFEKETSEVSMALASARQATGVFQSELTSLKATIRQNETGLDQYGKSVKKLEGYHRSFSGGIRSSNSVAIEFSRIIQDAPYGMQGVANNLQQLTTNFGYYAQSAKAAAAESGQTLTKMQLLKGAFAGILSPVNLLTIGISLITAGWIAYQKWGQKAKDTTDDNKKSFDDLVKSLDEVRGALAKGEASSQKQITDLRLLYSATQNATLSIDDRRKAVDELQKQYPSYFGNLKDEQILAGEASGAYDTLTKSILATAQARAAADAIAEAAGTQLRNRIEIEQLQELLNKQEDRIKNTKELIRTEQQAGQDAISSQTILLRQLAERDRLGAEINKRATENGKINDQNQRRTEEITTLIQEGADVTLSLNDNVNKVNASLKETKDILDKKPLSPLEVSIKNAFDDLLKVRSQLEKIYNADAFNPFDLSGLKDKTKPEKPEKPEKKDTRLLSIIASGDGSQLSIEIAKIDFQISELREKFKDGLISPDVFRSELAELQGIRNGFSLIKTTMESVSDFAGDAFASILFDGEDAAKNLKKAFKSLASSIISDLIRIAATKAFANIFSGGLTGLFGGIGKIFGFAGGGYTGNVGKRDIAGLVHGQEFVVNAEATKKYRNLLNAINSGRVVKPNAIASGITGNGSNNISVEVYGRLAGQDLLVSNKRTERNNKRFYGIR